jgi:hypothetical protein
MTSDNGLF